MHASGCASGSDHSGSDTFFEAGVASFEGLGLPAQLVQRLQHAGFERPSRLQAQALPRVMDGGDVVLNSETGSGKTLAFVLPMLARVLEGARVAADGRIRRREELCGVVIVPSVDLARQIAQVITSIVPELAEDNGVFLVHSRFGPTRHQTPSIIVATPAALLENVRDRLLRDVSVVVVDEVDFVVSGQQLEPLQTFLAKMKMRAQRPQHIFAAATLPRGGKKSVRRWLDMYYEGATTVSTPLAHRVNPRLRQLFVRLPTAPEMDDTLSWEEEEAALEDHADQVELVRARALLSALQLRPAAAKLREEGDGALRTVDAAELVVSDNVDTTSSGQLLVRDAAAFHVPGFTLVFVSSAKRAEDTVAFLASAVPELRVAHLSKGVGDDDRVRLRQRIDDGELQVLVCTDLGSRGLDFHVDHVIQLDMAEEARGHLHRVGRTARAGRAGMMTAIWDDRSARLVGSLLESQEGSLEDIFSRKRSFSKRKKREEQRRQQQGEQAEDAPNGSSQ